MDQHTLYTTTTVFSIAKRVKYSRPSANYTQHIQQHCCETVNKLQ